MRYRHALFALLLLPAAAFAQSDADRAAIAELAGRFETVTRNADMAGSLQMLPPTLIDSIAAQLNITREEYVGHMIQAAEQTAALIQVREVEIDMEAMDWHEAPDGTPYALIPTRSVVEVREAPGAADVTVLEEDSRTLALKDGGEWHLVRLGSDKQQDSVRMAFPNLHAEDFPLPQMKELAQ